MTGNGIQGSNTGRLAMQGTVVSLTTAADWTHVTVKIANILITQCRVCSWLIVVE